MKIDFWQYERFEWNFGHCREGMARRPEQMTCWKKHEEIESWRVNIQDWYDGTSEFKMSYAYQGKSYNYNERK